MLEEKIIAEHYFKNIILNNKFDNSQLIHIHIIKEKQISYILILNHKGLNLIRFLTPFDAWRTIKK